MKKIVGILMLFVAAQSVAHAQLETQIVALIDKHPIVLEAPYPFIEVSRVLPELFDQRRRRVAERSRIIAWFIPRLALKDQLNERTERPRSLQVDVIKEMEKVRYESKDLRAMRDEFLRSTSSVATLNEEDTDTLFNLLDLGKLGKTAGGQKILGVANLGPDSFTLCIATSAEGRDLRGGREVEASVACVTHVLINEKILLLTVSGPEISAKELRNSMRLTREWVSILREHNNAGPAK